MSDGNDQPLSSVGPRVPPPPDGPRGQQLTMFSSAIHQIHSEGFVVSPLPSPQTLGQYEAILPGTAERLMTMLEKEQAKRHERIDRDAENGKRAVTHLSRLTVAGMACAFIVAMTGILGGLYLASLGKEWTGMATALAAIGGLVSVFIYQQRRK